ncbi:MAG: HD domain-containing protein [Patescibacteria group bacterium]|jgi:hypothetical protein
MKEAKDIVPEKFQALWEKCLPIFEECREGDREHALTGVKFMVNYKGDLNLDDDILIPVAIMHDIGHSAILPEHFKYITGVKRVKNGKLAHMLIGAKIAHKLLTELGYDQKQVDEIVDIISMHDIDQLDIEDARLMYDSENKKIFHDIDSLDRYEEKRLKSFSPNPKDMEKALALVEKMLDTFFYSEFKALASANLEKIKASLGLS